VLKKLSVEAFSAPIQVSVFLTKNTARHFTNKAKSTFSQNNCPERVSEDA
jgi:hypothetical protein